MHDTQTPHARTVLGAEPEKRARALGVLHAAGAARVLLAVAHDADDGAELRPVLLVADLHGARVGVARALLPPHEAAVEAAARRARALARDGREVARELLLRLEELCERRHEARVARSRGREPRRGRERVLRHNVQRCVLPALRLARQAPHLADHRGRALGDRLLDAVEPQTRVAEPRRTDHARRRAQLLVVQRHAHGRVERRVERLVALAPVLDDRDVRGRGACGHAQVASVVEVDHGAGA